MIYSVHNISIANNVRGTTREELSMLIIGDTENKLGSKRMHGHDMVSWCSKNRGCHDYSRTKIFLE
jgi:hypothetical protein